MTSNSPGARAKASSSETPGSVSSIFSIHMGTRQKKNVENSTLGLTPPPMTEIVENFQKKKTKKSLKNLKNPIIRQFP